MLEYIKCEGEEYCMEGAKFLCSECGVYFCRQHVIHYNEQGKFIDEPRCPRCHPLQPPKDVQERVNRLRIGF